MIRHIVCLRAMELTIEVWLHQVRVAGLDWMRTRSNSVMVQKTMCGYRTCVWEHHSCIPDTSRQLGKELIVLRVCIVMQRC